MVNVFAVAVCVNNLKQLAKSPCFTEFLEDFPLERRPALGKASLLQII